MARRHTLFHGTLLLTAASLALRGSSMCFQVYLSNKIGAAGIGLLQLITSVSFLAMTLGSAGVRVASMYLTAEEYGAQPPRWHAESASLLPVLWFLGQYRRRRGISRRRAMDCRALDSGPSAVSSCTDCP